MTETETHTIPCPRCFGARQVEMLIQPMVGASYFGPVRCPECGGFGRHRRSLRLARTAADPVRHARKALGIPLNSVALHLGVRAVDVSEVERGLGEQDGVDLGDLAMALYELARSGVTW